MVADSFQGDEERIDETPEGRIGETSEETVYLDPAKVRGHFDRIGRFRVLVVGRSNAGKTTLLQRVCNTTELPEIYDSNGEKVNTPTCAQPRYRSLTRHNSQLDLTLVQGSLEVSWKH